MERVNLTELFLAQFKLDENIAINHNVTYKTTRSRRILSLIVEIGELANSTRCFKYWSNKPSESKERVLDEYADGLHFFLSLGIDIGVVEYNYIISTQKRDLTDQFLEVYSLVNIFYKNQDEDSYIDAFTSFLSLLPLLGYSWQDLHEAYFKKLDENYIRQKTNY